MKKWEITAAVAGALAFVGGLAFAVLAISNYRKKKMNGLHTM